MPQECHLKQNSHFFFLITPSYLITPFNYYLRHECDATKRSGFCRRSSNTIMKHQQVTNNGYIWHMSIKLRIQLKIAVLFESQM